MRRPRAARRVCERPEGGGDGAPGPANPARIEVRKQRAQCPPWMCSTQATGRDCREGSSFHFARSTSAPPSAKTGALVAFRRGRYARAAARINENRHGGRCAGSAGESSTSRGHPSRSRNLRDAAADDAPHDVAQGRRGAVLARGQGRRRAHRWCVARCARCARGRRARRSRVMRHAAASVASVRSVASRASMTAR